MSMIKCPECKKETSGKAKVCINCGITIKDAVEDCAINEMPLILRFIFKMLKIHDVFGWVVIIPLFFLYGTIFPYSDNGIFYILIATLITIFIAIGFLSIKKRKIMKKLNCER